MDIVLARILRYLNGCIENNAYFRIATFIIENYEKVRFTNETTFLRLVDEDKEDVYNFLRLIGQKSYSDFQMHLLNDYELRCNQIRFRMIGLKPETWVDQINVSSSKEEFLEELHHLCEEMYQYKRIIIVGSHFPCSLTVDFQTDMITLDKCVLEYHYFDKDFQFNEDDLVFFISATGRTLDQSVKRLKKNGLCKSQIVLITQNIKYTNYDDVCADEVIHLTGRFDGFGFNYDILRLFDLLRITYYKKYYL